MFKLLLLLTSGWWTKESKACVHYASYFLFVFTSLKIVVCESIWNWNDFRRRLLEWGLARATNVAPNFLNKRTTHHTLYILVHYVRMNEIQIHTHLHLNTVDYLFFHIHAKAYDGGVHIRETRYIQFTLVI